VYVIDYVFCGCLLETRRCNFYGTTAGLLKCYFQSALGKLLAEKCYPATGRHVGLKFPFCLAVHVIFVLSVESSPSERSHM
jgi:hypothetical protein